ncbi:hypothetical protein T06_6330 [Trichinella sp. T6]|nr:hypothetical protein T06_6330 [Trichinella sp. T6]
MELRNCVEFSVGGGNLGWVENSLWMEEGEEGEYTYLLGWR